MEEIWRDINNIKIIPCQALKEEGVTTKGDECNPVALR